MNGTPSRQSGKPTEVYFDLFLFLLSLFFFLCSLSLFRRDPSPSGSAALPLASCGLLCAATLIRLCKNRNGFRSRPLFPGADFLLPAGLCALYCLLLTLGLPFLIVTPLFLFGAARLLEKGKPVCDAAVSVLFTLLCYLIFNVCFGVML